jgi:hypothetical protein
MSARIIAPIIVPDLGRNVGELVERVQRVHGAAANVAPGLSVGGCESRVCRPFGGKPSKAKTSAARAGLSVGQSGAGASEIMQLMERMGAAPCRQWGAQRPGNNCKEICGAIYPYQEEVAADTTGHDYETYAKVWFQPLFWVDTSGDDIVVEDLLYTGDPVFENGEGSGALDVGALLGPDGYYSFVPGLPAFDNKVPLVHRLANGHASAAQNYQGMLIGISARS